MCYVSADTHTFFFTHWTAFMIMGLDRTYHAHQFITTDTGRGTCFCPCLFVVCLLARLLKNARMDLDEMLRVDRCRDMDELFDF